MDVAWRFRIMVLSAVALIIFGDFFGYTGNVRGVKSATNQAPATGPGKFREKNAEIEINDDTDLNELTKQRRDLLKLQLTDAIKESCLPKMLCEMASKPDYVLNEKERDLLSLIRASTNSLAINSMQSKWHFAAHMGELMRYTGEDTTGPMGCAYLWPSCPISSKKLTKLSYKVKI